MSHKLKYIIPFKSILNNSVEVHFLLRDYKGSPVELKGTGEPLTLSIDDDDFLYTPIRTSSCKINIFGSDYLQELFSTDYTQWKINIIRNKSLVWTGYIKPEIYTQDYTNKNFELSIEAVSALSVLDNIEYSTPKKSIITIWSLLEDIIKVSKADWKSVVIPEVYGETIESITTENIFKRLFINEANFFDEEDTPMTYLEVLEELCKFLNWTVTDWTGSLAFIDIDHKGTYRIYDKQLLSYSTFTPKSLKAQDIGFRGGDHTLDIIGGYSKASVKVSNYNIQSIVEAIDYDKLKVLDSETGSNWVEFNTRWQVLDDGDWEMFHYDHLGNRLSNSEWKSYDNYIFSTLGGSLANAFNYEGRKSSSRPSYKESNYKYRNVILVRTKTMKEPVKLGETKPQFTLQDKPVLRIVNENQIRYSKGAISINFTVEALTFYTGPEMSNVLYAGKKRNGIEFIEASLRIGDKWWGGAYWGKEKTTFKIPLNNDSDSSSMNIITNKILFRGPNGATGHVVDLWSDNRRTKPPKVGDFELILYSSTKHYKRNDIGGFHIENLKIDFHPLVDNKESKGDRIYENIVNDQFINELDTIEFKLSSFNNDSISYSKVMLDEDYIQDNLYSTISNLPKRTEELLIERIIKQYKQPKIKLTQELKYTTIEPFTSITDQFMEGKLFTITGSEIDFYLDRMTLNLVENVK